LGREGLDGVEAAGDYFTGVAFEEDFADEFASLRGR
jgi:hypothetical protein